MSLSEHVATLLAEAERTNERRVIILTGDPAQVESTLDMVLDGLPIGIGETVAVSSELDVACERIDPSRSVELMGSETRLVLLDLRTSLSPNALGRCGGAVTGAGLLVLLCPPLETWPDRRDDFDRSLVVEPDTLADVTGQFRRWVRDTLQAHPGISIIDVDESTVVKSGITGAEARSSGTSIAGAPRDAAFPSTVYDRCRTDDQRRAVERLATLREPPRVVVIEADRGRGKSSVAGLVAGALVGEGHQVAVTAPEPAQATPLVEQAINVLVDLTEVPEQPVSDAIEDLDLRINGGRLTFVQPAELVDADPAAWDAIFADEAAGLPVPTLTTLLASPRVVCTTTLHGYEGSGQGFRTKFMAALRDADHALEEITMTEPIRYAAGDPIEAWLNRVLLLDARPAVAGAVEGARPATVSFDELEPERLFEQPEQFREAIGLLAMAHYRTEPDDIARLLDAPNLKTLGLWYNGHVAAIALVAREGDVPADRRDATYRGERIRGNLVPDVFISEYRDRSAAAARGVRIVRIATHPAVRRRGLASQLLEEIVATADEQLDWIGAGFGATPELVGFWADNGFVPMFLSASRNASSGAYSTVMLRGHSERGSELVTQYGTALPQRMRASLADVHREVDPAVVDALFDAMVHRTSLSLSPADWRFVASVAFGPGRYDLHPAPIKSVVLHHFTGESVDGPALTGAERELLIRKVLQGRSWTEAASAGEYDSVRTCRRALGAAMAPLADAYGGDVVSTERERLKDPARKAQEENA